ncbi:MAG: chemotaxis protein [Rhodocyclaceae bacterium]
MSELISNIDARTRLAGTNKLEILLFSLGGSAPGGRRETYGINVFKVREVMRTPAITAAPRMPASVRGMASLRGTLIPVVDLGSYCGIEGGSRDIMIVTEYNGYVQGFLVEAVDTILRLDWSQMRVPPEMLNATVGGLTTAVTELADGRLVMMLDVEKLLSDTTHYDDEMLFAGIAPLGAEATVVFADDSPVARGQIRKTLELMGLRAVAAINGAQAWSELQKIAEHARALGVGASDLVHAVVTDIEMPEMDGFMLTRKIRSDERFAKLPVVMHSSLSGTSNRQLAGGVGIDAYVSKLEPRELAATLAQLLRRPARRLAA